MSERPASGVLHSAAELASRLLALVHNRVELAGTELEIAARELLARLVWALLAFVCAWLSLVMLAVLVLVVAWDHHRLAAALGLTAGFALLALAALVAMRRQSRRAGALLAGTLGELRRDIERLKGPQ